MGDVAIRVVSPAGDANLVARLSYGEGIPQERERTRPGLPVSPGGRIVVHIDDRGTREL